MPRNKAVAQSQELTARIDSYGQSYFISEHREHQTPISDEALIEIVGQIENISPKLKQHRGEAIAISLVCAQSFPREPHNRPGESAFMVGVNLSKRQRSLMAYLPATVFWSIPSMIDTGKITHIEASFAPIRYGRAELVSLFFASEAQVAELSALRS